MNTYYDKRSDVPENYTWDLRDLFNSDDDWREEYKSMKSLLPQIEALRGKLGKSACDLLNYLNLSNEIGARMERLYGYAGCKNDEDTANSLYQDMKSKAVAMSVELSTASAFSEPEIIAIDEETLNRFYSEEPKLESFRRNLFRIRRMKAHILSDECEQLLSAAGEMAGAPENIHGILSDADLTFPDVEDSAGEKHSLTNETLVLLLESPDRTLRKNTFDTYYSVLSSFRNTFASVQDAQMKQLRFFSAARHYSSSLEASLSPSEIPVDVYTNLIRAVRSNLPALHQYVGLRKRLLGVDELHMYDIYTPIVPKSVAEYSFEKAKELVLEALSVLGDDYTAMLREGFDNRWIDVYENRGKRGGAYSTGTARPHPYVLLNHKDNLDSVFTLAHEMGHALHSYLSCKNQPYNTSEYELFVAEVASTCNEVLLMRYLLRKTSDSSEKAYLINHFLDQFKGTIYRQTQFAEFELEMGQMAERNEALTADVLSQKYAALNREYYGPDMAEDEAIAMEWARIPHFFYDYYVYQYATGFSAAVALADRILSEGAPAVKDYKKFLSGGCSTDPISLLKIAGVDMSTPAPVNEALKLFKELVNELELTAK